MEVTCTSSKNPRVVRLPDELVAEILARVPYRSLCQFKCVSQSWRALCSKPDVFRRCPQTLAGFFFDTISRDCTRSIHHFVNLSGRGPPMVNPSWSFIPPVHSRVCIVDSCNGLLLCRCDVDIHPQVKYTYFVCNPATDKWINLPNLQVTKRRQCLRPFRLGFDPAVSSHFRVFVLESEPRPPIAWGWDQGMRGVEIFSSETGAWSYRKSEWGDGNGAVVGWNSVFFDGTLHLTSPGSSSLLTVDMDGRAWGKIPTPHDFGIIGVSQGRLHAVQMNNRHDDESISIWVLEDYAGQRWILKHAVTAMQMFGARPRSFGDSYSFLVHAVHPEHGLIFLSAGNPRRLMSYNVDKKEVRFIWTLGEDNMFAFPYVPCFSGWLSDGH